MLYESVIWTLQIGLTIDNSWDYRDHGTVGRCAMDVKENEYTGANMKCRSYQIEIVMTR